MHRYEDIMLLLSRGWSNQEIARELGLTIGSVRMVMSRTYRRYGVTGTSKRVKLALIMGTQRGTESTVAVY
jgi:DNA-binding NarL/FixJ family response regulator